MYEADLTNPAVTIQYISMTFSSSAARRGFTLIELLVVIAIIGILSSVVLASLNTARARGADAAIRSNINNARAQAELFFDQQSPNTYVGVCANTTTGIAQFVTGAGTASGGTVFCNQDATRWVLAAPLRTTPASSFCVDSTGAAVTRTGNPAAGALAC